MNTSINKYSQFSSKEENIAFEIYQILNKNFGDSITNNLFIHKFHFEIVNDFYNKNVFFSYVLKDNTNIEKVEMALMAMGINKQFVDKSNPNDKRFLSVWKE